WIDGTQKDELLTICDILVLPSYSEGLPMSILEAMSYGKTIISTSVGGIPEIVKEGENGFLVTPGDKRSLSEVLNKILGDRNLLDIMGNNSQNRIQPYLIYHVFEQLKSIYQYEELDQV